MKMPGFLATLVVLAGFTALDGYAQISVRSGLSDDREAVSGMVYEGTILIKNETDEPQQAKIYQTDYLFFYDGTNLFAEPGSTPRSMRPRPPTPPSPTATTGSVSTAPTTSSTTATARSTSPTRPTASNIKRTTPPKKSTSRASTASPPMGLSRC